MTTTPMLTAATVDRSSGGVALSWTVEGELPERDTWMLSTTLHGDGAPLQFGFKVLDGELVAQFVFDHGAGVQYNYPGVTPQRRGDRWVMVFPSGDVDPSSAVRWEATLNIAGDDENSVSNVL